jgi:glycosyltransferase involved in cell wall biosynthesis
MSSPPGRLPLTVLVPTFNEEELLEACLDSVADADELLVVDSFSTDRTVAIAGARGARVIQREYGYSASQKNWAIPQAKHEWILLLDADERATPALLAEIRELLEAGPRHDGYWIRRRNHFLGREMKHGGWETDAVIRLFRRDAARYQDREVHAEIELPGPLPALRNRLDHYSFRSWEQYWPKIAKYTDWGASQALKDGKRAGAGSILVRPLLRFLKMYVIRLGFLDGVEGAQLALLGAFSVYLKYSKLWELSRRAPRRGGRA